jgi:hypothetical protein
MRSARRCSSNIRDLSPKIGYSPQQETHATVMSDFDYMAPAELFAAHGRSGFRYRRFPRAAEAIRYAIEKLPANFLAGTRLEVEKQGYDGKQIRLLYESETYPLTRKLASS